MKKIKLSWGYLGFMLIMAIGVSIGVIAGTSQKFPYEERTYLLSLAIIALILFLWYSGQYDKQKEIEKQKELKDKETKVEQKYVDNNLPTKPAS